jgi:hypothetical protein
MATKMLVPQSLFQKLVTLGLLAAVTFVAFGLAVGYAPVLVPTHLFALVGAWYFALLSVVAALAVSLTLGVLCAALFPARPVPWALLCSSSVAVAYLAVVFAIRAGTSGHVWWTPVTDAVILVGGFTSVSWLGARAKA